MRMRVFATTAAVLAASAAYAASFSWVAPAAYEEVSGGAVTGTGVTGWSASVNVSFDASGTGAAGDDAGWADITVTSALYGDFLGSSALKLAALPDASYPDCTGSFAAVLPSGVRAMSNQWDNPPTQQWGWLLDGSYFCFQNPGADKPLHVSVTASPELGALWPSTGGSGSGSSAAAGTALQWTGLAAVSSSSNVRSADAAAQARSAQATAGGYVEIGGNPKAALRDAVRKNVSKVTRGLTAATTVPASPLAALDAASLAVAVPQFDRRSNTLFFDLSGQVSGTCLDGNCGKTVEIRGAGVPAGGDASVTAANAAGILTVIVKGGNLRISSDLYYPASGKNLVTFVVLKDDAAPKNGGNVYVDPGVTNLVGTFVLDGAMVNATSTAVLSSASAGDRDSLRRQLLLYGSLASSNSVGGSSAAVPKCQYGTDAERQGIACTKEWAAKYDLAAFRAFYLGTSRKPDAMPFTAGAPAAGMACNTGSGALAYEVPRATQRSASWDAQPWGWAGKRKCALADPVATGLRPAPSTAARASIAVEYNTVALSAAVPVLTTQAGE